MPTGPDGDTRVPTEADAMADHVRDEFLAWMAGSATLPTGPSRSRVFDRLADDLRVRRRAKGHGRLFEAAEQRDHVVHAHVPAAVDGHE